ncbi:MAG: hypothetical protein ACO1RT_13380 [Planctomycetaceae bacterium]
MIDRLTRDDRIELSTLGYVIIALAIGVAAGRIAVVRSAERDTAFLSANDRSRWCTVAALVEDGTYAIDRQIKMTDASGRRHPWSTIDRVRHTGSDGQMHDYSSKPPLFSTMIAGVYWVVRHASQMTLTEQPVYVARIVIALVNLPMLLIMLVAVWRSILDSYAPASAKLFGLAVAGFGTALLPMSVSINNHLPAAMATAVVLCVYLGVAGKTQMRQITSSYFVAGLAAAFAVANELPALAMLAAWTLLFLRQHVWATISVFLPAVLLVTLAFVITNQLAHQSFRPPYMHRSDGPVIATLNASSPAGKPSPEEVSQWLEAHAEISKNKDSFQLLATRSPDRWIVESGDGNLRYALLRAAAADTASPADAASQDVLATQAWNLHQWDNWYDYPGSYWTAPRQGVDRGEPSRLVYLFHVTLGHHGIFSLTPVWLLVPLGLAFRMIDQEGRYRYWLAVAIAMVSLICMAFYISRPLIDRNYGGVSSSFRWMLWFTPLWIWAMIPAVADAILNKWARPVILVLLSISVFSAATALENPWQHPWIYRYLSFLGWLGS